jgi:proline iminopeptidase
MTSVPDPFASGLLEVEPGVEIYWEQSGNPVGKSVLYLHGGPGSGLGDGGVRQVYAEGRACVVALDQRGCGRSRPLVSDAPSSLKTNTTQALIRDLEALREHLGIERWLVSGISWGTTLALAYALAHPERVSGLALAAITTTSREEVDWLTEDMGRIFPEAWERFAAASGRLPAERIVDAYARRLAGEDAVDRAAAAVAWDSWENTHMSLAPGRRQRTLLHQDPNERLLFATLVTHYFSHEAFLLGEQAILVRARELTGIPLTMVHGRHDISGPVITPWRIQQALPAGRLVIVEGVGHGGPGIYEPLARAVSTML